MTGSVLNVFVGCELIKYDIMFHSFTAVLILSNKSYAVWFESKDQRVSTSNIGSWKLVVLCVALFLQFCYF